MVIAYHLIWTVYGYWLPNDPRGSMSRTIRNEVIAELGEIHHGRKELQPTGGTILNFYRDARDRLEHPLLELTDLDTLAIARSFAATIAREKYTCYACAIMPDHVHILIRKHKHQAAEMANHLQNDSRAMLQHETLREQDHPAWGGAGWTVFLDTPEDIRRTIQYIERNPTKQGMPRQRWGFVKPYDGWPLFPGHNPNSPYARAIRQTRAQRRK